MFEYRIPRFDDISRLHNQQIRVENLRFMRYDDFYAKKVCPYLNMNVSTFPPSDPSLRCSTSNPSKSQQCHQLKPESSPSL
jgi:hypothetical protein